MQRLATCLPPAILFEKDEKTKKSVQDNEKDKYKTFEIKLNKKEKDSEKYDHVVKIFEDGSTEDYCRWYMKYTEVKSSMPLDTPMKQIKIIRSILKNTYLEAFNNHLSSVENEKDKNSPTEEQVEEALAKVTLKAFANDRHAYRRQVRYMRYQLYFTTTNFENFFHRLKQMNTYLKYFPIPPQKGEVEPLSDEDLIEIIDNAKPLEYNQAMLQNNYDPYDKTLDEFARYIEKLEQAAKFTKLQIAALTSSSGSSSGKRKKKDKTSESEGTALHKCKWCKKMVTHEDDDCWEKPGNEDVVKPHWAKRRRVGSSSRSSSTSRSSSDKKKKSPTFTGEQLSFLIQNAHVAAEKGKKTKKTKKRKVTYKSESDSDNEEGHIIERMSEVVDSDEMSNSSSESCEDYFMTSVFKSRTKKKKKNGHLTTEIVGEIVNRDHEVTPIRCLLDTGTTSTIILKPFVNKMSRFKHESTKWRTMGGTFKTRRKAQIELKFPEFSHNKTVTWIAHVDETTKKDTSQYDMIIGTDLMSELQVKIDYETHEIEWDDVTIPMKQRGTLSDPKMTHDIYELQKSRLCLKCLKTGTMKSLKPCMAKSTSKSMLRQ